MGRYISSKSMKTVGGRSHVGMYGVRINYGVMGIGTRGILEYASVLFSCMDYLILLSVVSS